MTESYRIAIVGASSLRGKELNETLSESSFAGADFLLMDDRQALGQLEAVGDEVTFVQEITPDSFVGVDFAFFAGDPAITSSHWKSALGAGASIVDLTYVLEGEAGVLVRAPWMNEGDLIAAPPGLQTPAVVPAHPAAAALALLLERSQAAGAIAHAAATIFEPASEYGRAAMDELHQQTVALLSFQALPKNLYDVQIAFNTIAAAGEESKVNLAETEERIRRHYSLISANHLPPLPLQLVHAPVFHGHCFSIALTFERPIALEHVEAAVSGPHVELVPGDADAPSNLSSAGQEEILVRVRAEGGGGGPSAHYWLWASTDNLKLAARNAVDCAQELRRLRPRGTVQ